MSLIAWQTQVNLPILMDILLLLWGVFFLSRLIPGLLLLGIIPRKLRGLPGIIFAPFLHAHVNHLFFNCIPLCVLSNFILIYGLPAYLYLTLFISLFSGVAIWCFAVPGLHIGASAVITGYWSFLVINAYKHGGVTTFILAALSIYYFAGIFLGIFPGKKAVSWQGHLFGLLAGIAAAFIL